MLLLTTIKRQTHMNNVLRALFTVVMIACSTGHAMEGQQAHKVSVKQLILRACQEKKPLSQERLLTYAATLDETDEFKGLEMPERIRMNGESLSTLIQNTFNILAKEEANLEKDKPRSWAPYTLAAAGLCCGLNFLKVRFCGSSGEEPCEKIALFLGGLGIAEWKSSREECKHTQEERIRINNGRTVVELVKAKTVATLQERSKKIAGMKVAQRFRKIIQETRAQRPTEILTTTFLIKELSTKVTEVQSNFSEYVTVAEAEAILSKVLNENMTDEELEELLDRADQEIHADEAQGAQEANADNNAPLTLEEKKKQ